MKMLWENEPDFINEEGVKWWLDKSTTEYAREEDLNGTKLDVKVWAVELPDKTRTRVIIDSDNNIICDNQSLEAILIRIDAAKILKGMK